jgi:uncharacterized membrane protein YphA (DoxX/SURF4 family)
VTVRALIDELRTRRWANLAVVNLRILLGFAFLPSGLKKVLDQPFTDPANSGTFHDFLHAFHATGFFYQFVGAIQLTIAVLLMTQRFALVGATMALPVFTAITVFCWSSGAGIVTCVMTSLMLLGTAGLLAWDYDRWRGLIEATPLRRPGNAAPASPPVDLSLWQRCGAGILVLYLAICAYSGGIYRPKGADLDNPAFYTLPLIALFPVVTFAVERHRRRQRPARSGNRAR